MPSSGFCGHPYVHIHTDVYLKINPLTNINDTSIFRIRLLPSQLQPRSKAAAAVEAAKADAVSLPLLHLSNRRAVLVPVPSTWLGVVAYAFSLSGSQRQGDLR